MHGVQPSPNITPSSGAPARPAFGRADGRTIRPANQNRSKTPANSSPSRMVTPPRICVTRRACPVSRWPSPPRSAPYVTATTENPRTNSAVPATTRLFAGTGTAGATGRAATASPEAPDPAPAPDPPGPGAPPAGAGPGLPVPAPAIPVTNERYPGTSGRQQGDRNVTAPAAAATGSARSSGPEVTSWPTPLTRAPSPGRQGRSGAGGQS